MTMPTTHIEFLVEEASMEVFLQELLPRLLNEMSFAIYSFQGKRDLLDKLAARLRGYAHWLPDHYRLVVLVDRDSDDCAHLKQELESIAAQGGLATRSRPQQGRFAVLNRIAIEELEAWYFGDWEAVQRAYPRVSPHVPQKRNLRIPDAIAGGTWEAFERELQKAGYFRTGLRKIEAARAIAPHLDPARNTSHSFQVFWQAVQELAHSTGPTSGA